MWLCPRSSWWRRRGLCHKSWCWSSSLLGSTPISKTERISSFSCLMSSTGRVLTTLLSPNTLTTSQSTTGEFWQTKIIVSGTPFHWGKLEIFYKLQHLDKHLIIFVLKFCFCYIFRLVWQQKYCSLKNLKTEF